MYPISQGKAVAYDKVATMFSPDGRLYQVEYASKIVNQGTLGCGLVYKKGIILGAEKKVPSKLVIPQSVEKLFKIDNHVAVVSSGLVGDARRLVELARAKAQENMVYYDESIHIETLVKDVAAIKHAFTQYGGMRPFGVSFVVGGFDDSGARLFETEPSGALAEYKAVAIGNNKKDALKVLEKSYKENLSLDDGIGLILKAINASLDEKKTINQDYLDFAYIDDSRTLKYISSSQMKAYVSKYLKGK